MAGKAPNVLLANGFRTTVLISFLLPGLAAALIAKEKTPAIDPNDPTLRLFHLIDNSYGGKLAEFYILADIYKDQKNPNEELQRVLRVEYDKSRAFGKLSLYVRTVGKMEPDQATPPDLRATPERSHPPRIAEETIEEVLQSPCTAAFSRPFSLVE
ncbi:MAG: hypothetical protein DMG23_11240 [Acidobacteria bacterium]|nr:MAG: hypothetical protein DMG23_11240 [Acidobacteriota bacterium]